MSDDTHDGPDWRSALTALRARYQQQEIAAALDVDARTVRMWESGESAPRLPAQRLLVSYVATGLPS